MPLDSNLLERLLHEEEGLHSILSEISMRLKGRMVPSRWTCSAKPCGPKASTTQPTCTLTSRPADATIGQDSTAACVR